MVAPRFQSGSGDCTDGSWEAGRQGEGRVPISGKVGGGAADGRVVDDHKDSVAAAKKGKTVMEPEPQHNDNNHLSQSHDHG